MSRFFVGQRVRIVRDTWGDCPHLVGSETFVAAIDVPDVDGYTIELGIQGILAHPDELEPILPEGHKPCEEQFKQDLDRLLEREGSPA